MSCYLFLAAEGFLAVVFALTAVLPVLTENGPCPLPDNTRPTLTSLKLPDPEPLAGVHHGFRGYPKIHAQIVQSRVD